MSIVCIGQLVADIVVRPIEKLPYPGRTEPVEDLDLLSGGCAANTAAVLAKLGAEASLVALIGRDAFGDAALADLKRAGVDVEAVRREAAWPTSVSIVMIDPKGERSFFYRSGGCEQLTGDHVPDAVLKRAEIVHIGGAMKLLKLDLEKLASRAKSFGCLTSLDTDWDVYGNWMKVLQGALPNIDYLFTNEEEAAVLSGKDDPREAAKELRGRGPKVVAVKRGERGAILATGDGISDFPAYRVAVKDTTCAGDAFAAGFLRGVSLGRPLDESARLGNAAGALCTTRVSHRGIASFEQVRRLVDEQAP
jgi:sugar/nucleoside kinase (ribokinase family)